MTGQVQQRVDLGDSHALWTRRDLDDLVTGFNVALFDDAKIETGPAVRDEEGGHPRLVHADADPVAGDARLRHFKHGIADPITIPDAHRVVGQPINGEILAELPITRLAAAELPLPVAIG